MYETRKEFLKEVMRLTGIATMAQADRVAQAVIGLIKVRIGVDLSDRIADVVPEDLSEGWRKIALPSEVMEVQEIMFELEEVGEGTPQDSGPAYAPEYG